MADLGAAVAVRVGEAGDGQARHEESLQHAVVNKIDALRFLAFVVKFVITTEPGVLKLGDGGVIDDGKKVGEDFFADVLGEGLALFIATLALALETVAENFMEEHGGGTAGENGWAVERLSDGRFAQRFEALAEVLDCDDKLGLSGKAVDGFCFESLIAEEVHAIVSTGGGNEDKARQLVRRDDARTFGGGEVVGLALDGEQNHVLVHVRIFAEDARQFPHPLLPSGAVDDDGRCDRADVSLRCLLTEVGRGIFLFCANLGFSLYAQVAVESVAVTGIGGQPKRVGESLFVVAERELQRVDPRGAMRAVCIVEIGRAHADLHVGDTLAIRSAFSKGAVFGANANEAGVADRVAKEVWGKLLIASGRGVRFTAIGVRGRGRRGWDNLRFAERGEGAMQLGSHGIEEWRHRLLGLESRSENKCRDRGRGYREKKVDRRTSRMGRGLEWRGTQEIG